MATTATGTVVSIKHDAAQEVAPKPRRIFALDSTKGVLVLTMVLYHWMNYFVAVDPSIYRYLRFLTPSFIFITGFLISYVYLKRDPSFRRNISKRLIVRGLKLLAIVLALNIAPALIAARALEGRAGEKLGTDLIYACLAGTGPIAFSVLVPIAYLLIASGILLGLFRSYRFAFHAASIATLVCTLILASIGVDNSYLQLASIGALGISIGHVSIERLHYFLKHYIWLIMAYGAYLAAITVWNATYSLQIIGVCLSVSLIYVLSQWLGESSHVGRTAILLGQYSLFGYIAQIVILQILSRALRAERGNNGAAAAAFAACVLCTIAIVRILESARARFSTVNTLYTAVFG